MAQSAIDLGIVILRKASGLVRFQAQSPKTQMLEGKCSTRVVLLVSEICQPFESVPDDDGEGDGQSFTTRLSTKIQELNTEIEAHQKTKDKIDADKKKAAAAEEFLQAQKLKDQARKNDKSLATLQGERDRLLQQRDTVCLRVLSIVSSLLRWSNSDLRKDPALMGALHQILLPMIALPALSKVASVQGWKFDFRWAVVGEEGRGEAARRRFTGQAVLKAIQELYAPGGGSRRAADAFLTEFGKSDDVVLPVSFELLRGHLSGQTLPVEAQLLLATATWRRTRRRPLHTGPSGEEIFSFAAALLPSAPAAADRVARSAVAAWLHEARFPLQELLAQLGSESSELILIALEALPEEANAKETKIDAPSTLHGGASSGAGNRRSVIRKKPPRGH
ncbi:unnamed protein product [Symbiodinium sp. CCMP2456]|nr:unnamed protein product [Symbiodinium sp. CCMP2456]